MADEIETTDWRLVGATALFGAAVIAGFLWVTRGVPGRALNPVRERCWGPHHHVKACRKGRPLCRWRRDAPCHCDAAPFPHRAGWCEKHQGVPLAVRKSRSYRRLTEAGESPSMTVQSLLFSRETFTPRQAKAWAKSHGYRYGKIDETDRYLRLRQADPSQFRTLRTISFGKGIRAIVAR